MLNVIYRILCIHCVYEDHLIIILRAASLLVAVKVGIEVCAEWSAPILVFKACVLNRESLLRTECGLWSASLANRCNRVQKIWVATEAIGVVRNLIGIVVVLKVSTGPIMDLIRRFGILKFSH